MAQLCGPWVFPLIRLVGVLRAFSNSALEDKGSRPCCVSSLKCVFPLQGHIVEPAGGSVTVADPHLG